ncbi:MULTISPECIES: hypothetical protein [unclassified Nocardia]|uniref:hypothetical protein n=1 Tax=unclassified Nocardia TaxID=2637762 RepID=UPI0024A96B40|nr:MULTISPECIES: hypothetical protein [unclassified Nocardia]
MTDEYVVDASAMVDAFLRNDAAGVATARMIAESMCQAPRLIDAEVGSDLRRANERALSASGPH